MKGTVFILTVGSYGDFFPLLELSKALVHDGFDVIFISNELDVELADYESLQGIQFRPFISFADIMEMLQESGELFESNIHNLQTVLRLFHRIAPFNSKLERVVGDVVPLCQGDLFFLCHPLLVNPMISIKQRFNVDYSIVNFSPFVFQLLFYQRLIAPLFPRFFLLALSRFLLRYRNIGLPERNSKHLIFVSKSFAPFIFRRAKDIHFSGSIRYDLHQKKDSMYGQLSEDIQRFLKKYPMPIVVTFGTLEGTSLDKRTLFKETIDCLKRRSQQAIILCKDDIFDDDIPDYIMICKFAPLYQILRYSSLLIYHGGIGTFYTAALAGVRHIVVPSAFDQFENAKLVRKLQLGVSISAKKYNQVSLEKALSQVLNSATIDSATGAVMTRFQAEDGIADAVDYVGSFFGKGG